MSELWQLILGKMFWALGICWKYWVITLNLDVFNPLRPMKAKILKLVIKYSHSEDIIRQFLCGSRLFRSLFYLSHNFLWEISHILRFDKARPCIGAFLYKSSNDQGFVRDAVYSNPWLPVKLLIRYGSVSYSFCCKKEFICNSTQKHDFSSSPCGIGYQREWPWELLNLFMLPMSTEFH